jgi:capsular polysaccharide biosynthesis protein
MSSVRQPPDVDAEREIDLARWRRAIIARWWIVAGGLVVGVVAGLILSVSGGSVYQASVLISPGQAFSPAGAPVLSYNSSPKGINALLTSEAVLKNVARAAHIDVAALRGNVSTQSVLTGVGAVATRGSVLVQITVQLSKAKPAEVAANALGAVVIQESRSPYVQHSVNVLKAQMAGQNAQLKALAEQIKVLNAEISAKNLDLLTKVVLSGEANSAALRQATITDDAASVQQQLSLIETIEYAQVIGPPAQAVQTTARSRRNSMLIGGLIGLILAAIAAIVADPRMSRSRPA